jgi:hypothetical protein
MQRSGRWWSAAEVRRFAVIDPHTESYSGMRLYDIVKCKRFE